MEFQQPNIAYTSQFEGTYMREEQFPLSRVSSKQNQIRNICQMIQI